MALMREEKAEIERQLRARERELHRDIDREVAKRPEHVALTGEVGDVGDVATADLIEDISHAEVGRDVNELHAISRAMVAIRDGDYGHCLDCGADIPFARLRAAPTALRCVRCQTFLERNFAGQQRGATL